MNVDEGNEIIAIYRGAIVTQPYSDYVQKAPHKGEEDILISGKLFTFPKDHQGKETSPGMFRNLPMSALKYHTSWSWLVEVMISLDIWDIKNGIYHAWCQCIQAIQNKQ